MWVLIVSAFYFKNNFHNYRRPIEIDLSLHFILLLFFKNNWIEIKHENDRKFIFGRIYFISARDLKKGLPDIMSAQVKKAISILLINLKSV